MEKIRLSNSKNRCYINVIMQIFFHSKNLFALLQRYYYSQPIKYVVDPNDYKTLVYIINDLRLKYCKYANIEYDDQCDSALFLNWLLDLLKDEDVGLEWLSYIACKKCKKISKKHYKEYLWIVYPQESSGLMDPGTFDQILRKQNNQTVEFKCEGCGLYCEHLQKFFVINEPKNIFFNFQLSSGSSIPELEESINLGVKKNPAEYRLKGVVLHRRDSEESGHYTILLKDLDEEWYHYNDATIRKINIDEPFGSFLKTRSRPLVWYERVD